MIRLLKVIKKSLKKFKRNVWSIIYKEEIIINALCIKSNQDNASFTSQRMQ